MAQEVIEREADIAVEQARETIALIGNDVIKSAVQLMVQPEVDYSRGGLNARFQALQDPIGSVTYIGRAYLSQRVDLCLQPAQQFEVTSRSPWLAYKKIGTELGDALHGHVLNLSAVTERPLIDIFDQTAADKKEHLRPAHTRLAIFEVLAGLGLGENITLSQITEENTSYKQIFCDHVNKMSDSGLLHYSVKPATSSSISVNPAQRKLAREVIAIQRGLISANPDWIAEGRELGSEIMSKPKILTDLLVLSQKASRNSLGSHR